MTIYKIYKPLLQGFKTGLKKGRINGQSFRHVRAKKHTLDILVNEYVVCGGSRGNLLNQLDENFQTQDYFEQRFDNIYSTCICGKKDLIENIYITRFDPNTPTGVNKHNPILAIGNHCQAYFATIDQKRTDLINQQNDQQNQLDSEYLSEEEDETEEEDSDPSSDYIEEKEEEEEDYEDPNNNNLAEHIEPDTTTFIDLSTTTIIDLSTETDGEDRLQEEDPPAEILPSSPTNQAFLQEQDPPAEIRLCNAPQLARCVYPTRSQPIKENHHHQKRSLSHKIAKYLHKIGKLSVPTLSQDSKQNEDPRYQLHCNKLAKYHQKLGKLYLQLSESNK